MSDKIKKTVESSAALTFISVEILFACIGVVFGLFIPCGKKNVTFGVVCITFILSCIPIMMQILKSIKDNY